MCSNFGTPLDLQQMEISLFLGVAILTHFTLFFSYYLVCEMGGHTHIVLVIFMA